MPSPVVAPGDVVLGHRAGHDGLLHEPPEEQPAAARSAPVEAEGELLEVGLEVIGGHGALMGAQHPPLEQAGDTMDARHQDVSVFVGCAQDRLLVWVAAMGQAVVGRPAIGEHRASGKHDVRDERQQVCGRGIGDMTHPHAPQTSRPLDLDGNDYEVLDRATPTFSARFRTSEESLVNFHLARESIALHANHCDAEALQHDPSDAVADTERALQGLGRQAVLRRREVPARFEPRRERRACLVEDRACGHGRLMATRGAHQPASALAPRMRRELLARRADKSVPPAQPLQVLQARPLVGESTHELPIRAGEVASKEGRRRVHRNILGLEELTDQPANGKPSGARPRKGGISMAPTEEPAPAGPDLSAPIPLRKGMGMCGDDDSPNAGYLPLMRQPGSEPAPKKKASSMHG